LAFAPDALVERLTRVLGDRATSVAQVQGQVVAHVDPTRWVECLRDQ
jgi:hypothetical protein